ncbi:MAG: 4-hydroxythreonine-4-phosphate dehydrogenase PdxA [Deltaproteobacteria bacterium]|nr:4-hydroxythreonine-4-phosphate dehydrogenase PdxA [Deltaproteobacteria bacterium]MBW1736139.1 4-hydroxythreonine-4-phosphate dehydrogenase PdxA [Deltaproteobacteria bacterium]MBW1908467.1 4-hydroxythreonine-4-phosphate dehydrogenase PdxA [Deltaproteobacteria bacterium]MBW2032518.1 4-hydroxythreonine-4-phosphate dehydrogenase PdxA [Deltaproteobacteria bacterium]MBW2113445.1 4-hydroxythreonine-4-phosphate dehydrogenase PdxA [Deltaproteobacteria bacterium]
MGDPAGIGPEIIVKALGNRDIYGFCRPVVLGDSEVLSSTILKASQNMSLHTITSPSEAEAVPGRIDLLAISGLRDQAVLPGKPTVEGGNAMVEYVIKAVDMCMNGLLGAMVTCPISKVLMHRAGYLYDGHTQLIAHLTNTDAYVMMLAGERLRVALVTIHCALKDVPDILNMEMVYETIRITARALRDDFGLENPYIAVAALNPHAGEEGLFGSEEEEIISPAVGRARDNGLNVVGPFPSDTLFYKAASGQFDAVVAMYHDQGLIPLKLLHFSDAVNVTLGLPIIRTSVDHGTAYDIAGTWQADASSLKAAIKMAARMVKNRAESTGRGERVGNDRG